MSRKTSIHDYQTVTPFLMCHRAAKVIDFLKGAFGASERERIVGARGRVLHAVLRVGDSNVMLGEPHASMKRLVAMPSHNYVFVANVARSYARALASGGKSFSKPVGPRLGAVKDPGGNFWWIAKKEIASPDVIKRRHAAYLEKRAK